MNPTAERLRALRERMGLTQTELSERLAANGMKYSQARISRLERGWCAPSTALITCLAHVLNVPFDELKSPTDQPVPVVKECDIVILDVNEVAWLVDRMPPSRRAEMLSKLQSTPYAHIAIAYGA